MTGPVTDIATEPVYYDLHLDSGASYSLPLPAGHNVFLYVYDGSISAGPEGSARRVRRGEMALLSQGSRVDLAAAYSGARLIVVGGRPLNEPIARYGPFVMNTTEEIYQAFDDYRAGRL